jgi:cell division protein ZapA (FtsZ GTPase activity inhibitor)
VGVNIAGSTLTIRTDASQDYVTRLEKYVNDKIEMVQPDGRRLSVRSALALAALSIADDYFSASEKQTALDRTVRDRLKRVLLRVDAALGPSDAGE